MLITRDVLLQAAEDPDVLRCFRLDDLGAPECHSALERYPLISQFTYDYRFRFTLCQALGDGCGGKPPKMLQSSTNLQVKALFNPINADPAAIAAVPGGVVIAPTSTAPSGSNASNLATPAAGTNGASSSSIKTQSFIDLKSGSVGNLNTASVKTQNLTALKGGSAVDIKAQSLINLKNGSTGTTANTSEKTRNLQSANRTFGNGRQLGITAKSLGATDIKNIGARVHVRHSNIQIKPNVSVAAKTIGVKTPTVKLNVATPAVKSLTIRTPTVRVVSVKTPTVRVPTITVRVPTVRIPR
jgi:hypothetical protein